jgi:hypothetical protein
MLSQMLNNLGLGSYIVTWHDDGSYEHRYVPFEDPCPAPSGPQVPPECWNSRPVDADRCMSAIRDMCRAV